ncbi:HAMP domain-containing sensor histidine kinase [Dactylosporangium sp. AC04546]|uniref:sensor histidine kinase n=1 Tax=Dactylosporangium sp. AC04546 TaxID=2862460 RepID=UPI001EDD7BC9|nr:HAMP domain-containing sensor histidine kinase [Dactylosporangium sp. AC04546]WVK79813.1 HAMP domain-containing sensor histidine kinase [Dactylosporangium sp. AC04546]
MRSALMRLSFAITSMIALAFLVPLGYVTKQIAHDRALAEARYQADAMVAALASVSGNASGALDRAVATVPAGQSGRLAVHLMGEPTVGTSHASAQDVQLAGLQGRSATVGAPGGVAYLQTVVLDGDRTAVVEVYVSDGDLSRGVGAAWLALAGLAVVLVAGSTLVADRLGAQIVRATRRLAEGARAFGDGDLHARVEPEGPPELRDAARSFNRMADQMVAFADAERELAADLSHRLRTPLTALRLDADAMPPGPIGERMRQAFDALDGEIEQIITAARRSAADRVPETTDLVEVVADRLAFWSVLAEDQRRPWRVVGGQEPVFVPVGESDLVSAVDCMLGNVFQHTPEGTGFEVQVSPRGLVVDDAGPGIRDPAGALRRGASGAGSTGLGLDIVRRVAETAGGRLVIDRSPLRGARVAILLEPARSRR